MFYEADEFAFCEMLRTNWPMVRREFDEVASQYLQPWVHYHLYDFGWDGFPMFVFGRKLQKTCNLCPDTTRMLEAIPGLISGGFSVLRAGARIKPHEGYSNTVLCCHLGIRIPEAGCGIRVGESTRNWQEGGCLLFDDTITHEAWNESPQDRAVLLINFLRSGTEFDREMPAELITALRPLMDA